MVSLQRHSDEDDEIVLRCAEQLATLSPSSVTTFAETLNDLSKQTSVTRAVWQQAIRWAHPLVRQQAEEVLTRNHVIQRQAGSFTLNNMRCKSVSLILKAIAPYHSADTSPQIYLSPPDLVGAVEDQVGELHQLLIALVAATRRHLTVVTPFFSPHALREILAPLRSSDISLSFYLSLPPQQLSQVQLLTQELFPAHNSQVFVNLRPEGRWQTLPHAKLILSDRETGYLGSANISQQGLHDQFEVGIRLYEQAVRTLEHVLSALVKRGVYEAYEDVSSRINHLS